MTDENAPQGDPRDEPGRFETKDLPGGYGPAQTPMHTTLGHYNESTDSIDYPHEQDAEDSAPADQPSVTEGGPTNVEKQAEAGNETPATPDIAEHEQAAETGQLHTPETEHDQQNAPA